VLARTWLTPAAPLDEEQRCGHDWEAVESARRCSSPCEAEAGPRTTRRTRASLGREAAASRQRCCSINAAALKEEGWSGSLLMSRASGGVVMQVELADPYGVERLHSLRESGAALHDQPGIANSLGCQRELRRISGNRRVVVQGDSPEGEVDHFWLAGYRPRAGNWPQNLPGPVAIEQDALHIRSRRVAPSASSTFVSRPSAWRGLRPAPRTSASVAVSWVFPAPASPSSKSSWRSLSATHRTSPTDGPRGYAARSSPGGVGSSTAPYQRARPPSCRCQHAVSHLVEPERERIADLPCPMELRAVAGVPRAGEHAPA
jgi:hypothetical protein